MPVVSSQVGKPRNFILGFGCQKGGTSWLHHTLSSHAECNFGFEKEYHIWDTKWIEECAGFKKNRQKRAARGNASPALLLAMGEYEKIYFDYFESLRLPNGECPTLTGDITPAYAGLNSEQIFYVASQLRERGFLVKPVFIMRDPVERVFSMIRMMNPKQDASVAAVQYARRNPNCFRTRYDITVAHLDKVFGNDVYYGFYDTMFSSGEQKRLGNYLGLPDLCGDANKKVRETSRKDKLKQKHRREMREIYSMVYAFCSERFGYNF